MGLISHRRLIPTRISKGDIVTQQLKKLLYNKQFVDAGDGGHIARWKISQVKVFIVSIALAVLCVLFYAFFFTKDPQNFLGNLMFYVIVLILAIVVIWLVGEKAWGLKRRISYFLLTFIILWVVYYGMSLLFGYLGLSFYIGGYALWVIMSILAGWGSKHLFDEEINKKDVFFVLVVFLVFVGANLPMNDTGGFLANFDKLIGWILNLTPKV